MKTSYTQIKKLRIILVAVMALSLDYSNAQAQSCSNPSVTTTANWLFNGDLLDASGNSHTLTNTNPVVYSTTVIEGTNSVNTAGPNPILANNDAPFTAAFTTKSVSMNIQANNPANGSRQWLYEEGDATNGISLYLSSTGDLTLQVTEGGVSRSCVVPYPAESPIEFHQIGFVYDGSGGTNKAWLYLDGYPVNAITAFSTLTAHSGLGIGTNIGAATGQAAITTNDEPFSGLIDDVAVYTTALTPKNMLDIADCAGDNLLTDLVGATCPIAAYLVQQGAGNWTAIDLVTGANTPGTDNLTTQINGIGFNEADGRIWGACQSGNCTSDQLVITSINPDGTFTSTIVGPIAGLPAISYNGGDVYDGVYYLTKSNSNKIYGIDADPSSVTYLQVINTITLPASIGVADIAINPVDGFAYGLITTTRELIKIDLITSVLTNLGPSGALGNNNSGWGAVYFDDQGYFYTSDNQTGLISRLDLSTNPGSDYDEMKTALFSDGPSSTANDGARCPGPLPIDWGDAPNSYKTLLADDSPRHGSPDFNMATGTSSLVLGSTVTIESEGQPDTAAALDADDGGTPPTIAIASGALSQTIATYSVDMAVQNTSMAAATACAWIDWNNNGTFDDGERQCVAVPIGATMATFTWTAVTLVGPNQDTGTYARFRITSDATAIDSATGATGSAADGEVEDYFILYTGTLPVELLFFTAEAVDNNAYLTWATATETNNAYFEVQQSTDGVNWTVISEVAGNGTTNTRHNYAYTHTNVSGVVFYRLKQVDNDGTASYSNIEVLNFASEALRLFPNPANDVLNITLGTGNNGRGAERIRDIVIYDMMGRVIQRINAGDSQSERIDISVLPAAMYMLGITTSDNTIRYEKFVKTNR